MNALFLDLLILLYAINVHDKVKKPIDRDIIIDRIINKNEWSLLGSMKRNIPSGLLENMDQLGCYCKAKRIQV